METGYNLKTAKLKHLTEKLCRIERNFTHKYPCTTHKHMKCVSDINTINKQ